MSELTIQLTSEELQKYNSKKRKEEDLPKVYSIASNSNISISRDMEAFLILEDFNFKDTITDSIKAILDNSTNELEKELFEEAWDNESKITDNQIADLNSKLGSTANIKHELRESKFVNVDDIGELLTAIASEQSSLAIKQRIAQYRKVYLKQFKFKFKPGKVSDQENRKAAESWLSPLTEY